LELFTIPTLNVSDKDIVFLRYLLISQDISLFIIPGVILQVILNSGHKFGYNDVKIPQIKDVLLVIVLTFCIFPITSFIGGLNAGMHFPDWLSAVEKWMIAKEERATGIIDLLISADTFWIMVMNLLAMAVLPAVGEELIFRGVFQKIGYKLFKSRNLAVWITAFVFSTIHFQFFGFFPRFILGLVYGYLFLWSGTLWLPVISHFINNAVPVAAAYIQGWDKFNTLPDISLWKQLIGLPIPIIISIGIMLHFRNISRRRGDNSLADNNLE
jgi:membrane protease YdiL (CAAX protease family)